MSKVTSKLQVTIPKVIADHYGIGPGSEILFEPAGEAIRILRQDGLPRMRRLDTAARLRLFDEAMTRANVRAERDPRVDGARAGGSDRGWTREELYEGRGLPR